MGCGWTHATKQCEITDVSKFFTPLNDKDACANSKKYVEKINCTFTPRDALISQYVEVFTRAFDLLTKYKEDYKRLMELYAKRSPEIVNVQSKDALKKLLKQYPFIQAMIELKYFDFIYLQNFKSKYEFDIKDFETSIKLYKDAKYIFDNKHFNSIINDNDFLQHVYLNHKTYIINCFKSKTC
jgi:hypothetical protein